MRGLHLTADLRGCAADMPLMTLPSALRSACLSAVATAGLTPVGELFHRFDPAPHASPSGAGGVTGVVLLAESHLAVHTWPEIGAATLDVYVCNLDADNSVRAETVMALLVEAFAPTAIERHAVERGALAAAPA